MLAQFAAAENIDEEAADEDDDDVVVELHPPRVGDAQAAVEQADPQGQELQLAQPPADPEMQEPLPPEDVDFDVYMTEYCKRQQWGHFRLFTWKKIQPGARAHGAIELTCPYHRKTQKTLCKKSCNLRGRSWGDIMNVMWALRNWANTAKQYDRQAFHLLPRVLDFKLTPAPALVQAQCLQSEADAPPAHVPTDEELDARRPQAKGRAQAKLAPAPKAKAAPKQQAVAAPKAKAVPATSSHSSASSSTSSSSSSSS